MEKSEKKELSQHFISGLPINEYGVVMIRAVDGTCLTNVPVSVIQHAPNGFSWGRSGGGAADLALNILEYAVMFLGLQKAHPIKTYSGSCSYEAWKLYQVFKSLFISSVPESGGVIAWAEIHNWLVSSLDNVPMPIPSFDNRTVTVICPRQFMNDFILAHPGADLLLSRTAFFAHMEERISLLDSEVTAVITSYEVEYYDGTFLVNDSADGLEEGELAQAVRESVFDLISEPEEWLITKGSSWQTIKKDSVDD